MAKEHPIPAWMEVGFDCLWWGPHDSEITKVKIVNIDAVDQMCQIEYMKIGRDVEWKHTEWVDWESLESLLPETYW